MSRSFVIVFLSGILAAQAAGQGRVLEEEVFANELSRSILVSEADFHDAGLARIFDSFIAENRGRYGVALLQVDAGAEDVRGRNCKCIWVVSFDWWKVLFDKLAGELGGSAELLILKDDVAVRSRSRYGWIETRVLSGTDPYVLKVAGATLRMVHLAITSGPRVQDQESEGMLRAYLVSDRTPSEALARAALTALRGRTGATQLEVVLRNDPWFITDMEFPVLPPYERQALPITREEYEQGAEWRCTVSAALQYCRSKGKVRD